MFLDIARHLVSSLIISFKIILRLQREASRAVLAELAKFFFSHDKERSGKKSEQVINNKDLTPFLP